MTAEEIMTDDVTTVNESSTLAEALDVLSELEIRHLPVVRGKEIVGMLSERDLRSMGIDRVTDLETLDRLRARLQNPVTEVMNSDVLTIDRAADVQEIIDLMLEERAGAVPVVDEDTNDLVGIVSYIDVLRASRELFG